MIPSLIILLTAISSSISSEILCIFPLPSHSHTTVYNAVTTELVKRGHKLTIVTTYPRDSDRNHENITLIDLSFVSVSYDKTVVNFLTKNDDKEMTYAFVDLVRLSFTSSDVQQLLKSDKKFDLLLIEAVGFAPFHAFAELFNVPVVGINSADSSSAGHEIMGNVMHPVAHPDRTLEFPVARTFSERLMSTVYWLAFRYMIIPMVAKEFDKITTDHFPNNKIKSNYELLSNVDLLLVNTHPAMGYIRPILPNTIQLGFLHIKDPQPVTGVLREILDKNVNGVVYVSFGTVFKVQYFSGMVHKLMKAFEELPYLFLWKYDGELENSPKNVILQKWFPQADLLAHQNIKLFITHGGQQSIEESISRRIPMLIMPIASDQKSNAIRASERQIASILEIHRGDKAVSSDDIKKSIVELISDKSYKENVEKLAKLVEDVPMTSLEKAVWWIEFVIRNRGARHFQYEQKKIPFYQFHYIDVTTFIVAVIVLIIVIIVIILRCITSCFESLMSCKSKRD